MPIRDIAIRSISGYVFVVPGLLLYFMGQRKRGKGQAPYHMGGVFVFCCYLIGILTMTGIGSLDEFSPRVVLLPFADIIKGPAGAILNVVLFFPLGFFLPLLYRKYNDMGRTVWTGFLLSLAIELLQMFGMGITDINDLITNTAGTGLGYFFYKGVSHRVREGLRAKFWVDGAGEDGEVLFLIGYSAAVMVTVQPLVIGSLFGLG